MDDLAKVVSRKTEQQALELMKAHICREIEPFQPGNMYLSMTYDGIRVEIDLMPQNRVVFRHGIDFDFDPNLFVTAATLGTLAGRYFASIREPIGDHICLGEN